MTAVISGAARPIQVVAESAVMDLHAFLSDAFAQVAPEVQWLRPDQVQYPDQVDVALCWYAAPGALQRYTGLQLVQSLAAGPDHLFPSVQCLPTEIPMCRIVDPLMSQAMAGYVSWAVLHHQRQFLTYIAQQPQKLWRREPVQAAASHCVGIAGLGHLGQACANALLQLGFRVRGWSRSAKSDMPAGLEQFAGDAQLDTFLQGCDTLVCLLPLTEHTRGFIGTRVLSQLPAHAHVVNVSRGEHVDEAALLAALNTQRIAHATLDAFAQEPLPSAHPMWTHPRVTVTPHVGARTPNTQVVLQMLDNLQAVRCSETRPTWVDRQRGY